MNPEPPSIPNAEGSSQPFPHGEMPPTMPAAPIVLAPFEPVVLSQRVRSVDTLRGVALLGILVMNIIAFAYPGMAYMNPDLPALRPYTGEFTGANKVAWWIAHTFFDLKMMSIFSMLFGAGLVLMGERSANPEPSQPHQSTSARRGFAGVYYRRLGWLFLIGMLHAYFIWWGDILVAYAMCGLLLYPIRRLRPGWLLALGIVVTLVQMLLSTGLGAFMHYARDVATEAQRILDSGGTITQDQQGMLNAYRGMSADANATPEQTAELIARWRGSLGEVLGENAMGAAMLQTIVFAIHTLWRALGMMLIGMALMKLGVFAAARSVRFYTILTGVGYLIGFPLVHIGGERLQASNFDMAEMYFINGHFNYVGSIFVALGHIGVVMLACRAGVLTSIRARLAAVGQMAFTNYLMQSILCTAFFNGWGLGQYATLERAETYIVVAVVWALELIWSPLWLARFRFGPAEWLWRSLTYWKLQPMRLAR